MTLNPKSHPVFLNSFTHRFTQFPVRNPCSLDFRFIFAYHASMFPTPSGRKTFVVTCKLCRRDVPSGREEFPFQPVAVECPLRGELRRYLPSEVFLGRPDQLVTHQQRSGGR